MLGVYSIVASVFMVFVTILNSGIPLAVSKQTVNYKDNKSSGSVCSGLIISLALVLFCIISILIGKSFFVSYFESNIAYILLLLLIPAILFTGIYAPFRGYLWGKEKFFEVSIVEFLEQIIRIGTYFLFILLFSFDNELYPVGLSASIACILSTIIGIVFYFGNNGRFKSPKNHFRAVFRSAAPITLVRLTTSLLQPFTSFLLPIMLVSAGFSTQQALSQIGIAMGMTMPLLSIPSTLIGSLAMAIMPNLTSLYSHKDNIRLQKQITSAISFTICCSFIVIPFFIALGEESCIFVYDNITAGTYLENCCWLIIPMGLSQITSSILNSLNLESKTFKYYLCSCIVLLLSIVILPKYVGIYALMYGTGFSMLVVAILNIIAINRTIGLNKTYIGLLLKLIVITIPCTYLSKWIYTLICLFLPEIICLIICGIISIMAFTLLMSVFNIVDISTIRYSILKKNKKQVA